MVRATFLVQGFERTEAGFRQAASGSQVRHLELNNGFVDYNSERIPLDVQADRFAGVC